jgi:hypothetical protein
MRVTHLCRVEHGPFGARSDELAVPPLFANDGLPENLAERNLKCAGAAPPRIDIPGREAFTLEAGEIDGDEVDAEEDGGVAQLPPCRTGVLSPDEQGEVVERPGSRRARWFLLAHDWACRDGQCGELLRGEGRPSVIRGQDEPRGREAAVCEEYRTGGDEAI